MTRKDKIGFVWVDLDHAFDSVADAKEGFVTFNEELGFSKEKISDYISTLDDALEKLLKISRELDAAWEQEREREENE